MQLDFIREGFQKNVKFALLAKVRERGVRVGFRGPTCYKVSFLMLKNGLKLQYYLITGPKLGGWRGQQRFSQKPKFDIFLKPSLIVQ